MQTPRNQKPRNGGDNSFALEDLCDAPPKQKTLKRTKRK